MAHMRAQRVAVLAAALSMYTAVDVRAQFEVEACTGQLVPASTEKAYLAKLENAVSRLNDELAGAELEMERFLTQADVVLRTLREDDLGKALLFAREVERSLEAGDVHILRAPTLVTVWAIFRLTFSHSLLAGDCLGEAEKLLATARAWSIPDPGVASGLIASHGGILIQLGRLSEAVVTLRPFLEPESAPKSFTELRSRFAALNNLGAALRQSGRRTEATRIYQKALVLLLDSARMPLIRSAEDRRTYESDLAKLKLNLAALALYNQDTERTWAFLQQARAGLERAGESESPAMVLLLRTIGDYWTELDDKDAARAALLQGLELAKKVAPESAALQSELVRRIEGLDVSDPELVRRLLVPLHSDFDRLE